MSSVADAESAATLTIGTKVAPNISHTNNNVVVGRFDFMCDAMLRHSMKKTGSSPTPSRYNIDGASFGRPRPEGPHSLRFEFPLNYSRFRKAATQRIPRSLHQ